MFLLIALFRMAQIFLIPDSHPASLALVESAATAIVGFKRRIEQRIVGAACFTYRLVEDIICSFLPLATIYCALLCWSVGWTLIQQGIFWFQWIYIFLSYGDRTIWEILRHPQRDKLPCARPLVMDPPIRNFYYDSRSQFWGRHKWWKEREEALDNFTRSSLDSWKKSANLLNEQYSRIWKASTDFLGPSLLFRVSCI